MDGLFAYIEFNGNISKWNTSNVSDMSYMFYKTSFNGDISKWDTSKVIFMDHMFYGAEKFNKDISCWNVKNVQHHKNIFDDCPIIEEFKPKFNE